MASFTACGVANSRLAAAATHIHGRGIHDPAPPLYVFAWLGLVTGSMRMSIVDVLKGDQHAVRRAVLVDEVLAVA
jgi:hypothetical protein